MTNELPAWSLTVASIAAAGFAYVNPLSPLEVYLVREYLMSRPVRPGYHVAYGAGAPTPWRDSQAVDVVCWEMRDVLKAPYLLEHALMHIDVASHFLEAEPVLYSVNAFCTRPSDRVRPDIQGWHRDADDVKFLPMFVYLTDVRDQEAQRVRGPSGEMTISGDAGTTFFSNTMHEHLGGKPSLDERIVYWARWGVSDPPPAYVWDETTPISKGELGPRYPADPRLQRAMRLLAI